MIPAPTARLEFRCWRDEDPALAELLWCDAAVTQFFGGAMTPDEVRLRVQAEQQRLAEHGFQYWPAFLRATGEFAGCAGLRLWSGDGETLEAGVNMVRAVWGMRLGEEAFRAALGFGFEQRDAEVIVAGHGLGHANSQAMMERIGFVPTHRGAWGAKAVEVQWYRLEHAVWRKAAGGLG